MYSDTTSPLVCGNAHHPLPAVGVYESSLIILNEHRYAGTYRSTLSSKYFHTHVPYLQLVSSPGQSLNDPWRIIGQAPVPLLAAGQEEMYAGREYVMEKNWMPWVYKVKGARMP